MTSGGTPVLDPRSAADFYAGLTALQPAFTPELTAATSGQNAALLQIIARFSSIVAQRLNQAPDLDKLAFLDMLGVNLIPAHPARAPLVFQPLPMTVDGHIPAGARAGASAPGVTQPTVFETETEIAMTAAKLVQVVSLWPDQDGFIDHSADLAGGRSFTLFQQPTPVEHVLYLSQQTLLAFKGKTTVEVRLSLAPAGSEALQIRWEFWDGSTWRAFHDIDNSDPSASHDGTAGLTRSGVVTLEAECGDSASTSVAAIANYWIRGRLTMPLPPDPARTLAIADQISLRTTIDRQLTHGPNGCAGPAAIDAAYAGQNPLDLTKIFYPLGKAPGPDAVFYLVSQEVLSKPGAQVTLCFDHAVTPEEEADKKGPDYASEIQQAQTDLVAAARDIANAAVNTTNLWINVISGEDSSSVQTTVSALQTAIGDLKATTDIPGLLKAFDDVITAGGAFATDSLNTLISAGPGATETIDTSSTAASNMLNARNADFSAIHDAYHTLSDLAAVGAAAAGGVSPPALTPPELVWEYYNGSAWATLIVPSSNDAANLLASGEITFTVPKDIAPCQLGGSPALAIRAKLASGSYNILRIITWTDPSTGQVNYMPVIQPRPSALKDVAIGYLYRSPWAEPDQTLTWNDFVVESHTPTAATPAAAFAPFHPVADTLPALYLGFDQPLPNDYLSIFFNITESDTDGPPLAWESWSAGVWQTLTVSDDTGALARPGMVAFLSPGVPYRPTANIPSASGSTVVANGALAASVFVPGEQIVVQPAKAAEVVTIDSIDGATINLVTPLQGAYTNTTAAEAALPRFGTSLDWVRARLKTDGAPDFSQVLGIYPNAVWARQVQTVTNETLGSGTGQPSQSLFFQQFPVLPGELVQVRELFGAQASVEFLVLQEQLQELGFSDDVIRTVTDPRSGLITEVWVTWIEQPNFYFSGPGDRHYVLERASGRILFGDGVNGMLPTPGSSNITAAWYQAGGGLAGNVVAGAINQLLGGAVAQGVVNPIAAEGGADTEAVDRVAWRGPEVLRHRGASLSAADYEALALEASPGVAIARCLPATSANLRPAPGYVTLILVPNSLDPQPTPSYELKQEVAAYLAARAPATIKTGRIAVIPPDYLPVGVSATVAARQIDQSGDVKAAVVSALNQFFHPLYGGPQGKGWPFGRSVHLSDVARLLEGIDGVDYVRQLELLLDLIPAGDQVLVPPTRMVAAGPMQIVMEGAPSA
jgi:hypothetical protein